MEPNQPASQLTDTMDGMDEVIKEFLVESNEGLDRFDRDLIALEKDKTSRELLDSIFRAVHTIKGTGGVLGYEKLVSISHVGESVLSKMRDGVLLLSPEIATVLLAMADSLRRILEQIALNGKEGDSDCSGVVQQLSAVLKEAQPSPDQPARDRDGVSPVQVPDPNVPPRLGEILVSAEHCKADDVRAAVQLQEEGDPRPLGEILVANRAAAPAGIADALKAQIEHHDVTSNTIRVDVALLTR